MNSETRKALIKAPNGKRPFPYGYDLGDGRDHRIKVGKRLPAAACPQVPYYVERANACLLGDIGGWPGYFEFLEVKADACDPDNDDMLEWHWESSDPSAFEGQRVNQRLINIKA